jgi:hypothetical protein
MYVVIATDRLDAGALHAGALRVVSALDPGAPVFEAATVESLLERAVATDRLAAAVAGSMALLALILAAALPAARRAASIGP